MTLFENFIRAVCLLISTCIAGAAYYCSDWIENLEYLNTISYVGTVATIIALLITISEVAQSVIVSKGIHRESKELLNRFKSIEVGKDLYDCVTSIDKINEHIRRREINLALKSFQHLRKTLNRINSSHKSENPIHPLKINEVEKRLQTFGSPYNISRETEVNRLIQILLNMKSTLENFTLISEE